jgi:hypothetical protein
MMCVFWMKKFGRSGFQVGEVDVLAPVEQGARQDEHQGHGFGEGHGVFDGLRRSAELDVAFRAVHQVAAARQ